MMIRIGIGTPSKRASPYFAMSFSTVNGETIVSIGNVAPVGPSRGVYGISGRHLVDVGVLSLVPVQAMRSAHRTRATEGRIGRVFRRLNPRGGRGYTPQTRALKP